MPVLRGVSLALERGEIVSLEGPSGSGKTTLLSILGCILTPSSGRVVVDGEEVDIVRGIENTVAIMEHKLRKGITVVREFAPDVPKVTANGGELNQIWTNLIDNALKYAGATNRIVLGSRALASGVEFYVQDFGPGISSEHLPRLFERFYRVDKARSRESGGTGLGLAIAKHIVLAHGGAIRAESELNHGSTFIFTLPLSIEEVLAKTSQ